MEELDKLLDDLNNLGTTKEPAAPVVDHMYESVDDGLYNEPKTQRLYGTAEPEYSEVAEAVDEGNYETFKSVTGYGTVASDQPANAPVPTANPKEKLAQAAAGLESLMSSIQSLKSTAAATNVATSSPADQPPPRPPKRRNPSSKKQTTTLHAPSKQGPGICAVCREPILSSAVEALDMEFHENHFVCYQCACPLADQVFFEKNGQVYCAKDYHEMYSPRCGYCSKPITDIFIDALGKKWHHKHFFCAQCGTSLANGENFFGDGGRPYCEKDYMLMFATLCGRCEKPVLDEAVKAMEKVFHPGCFTCAVCLQEFEGGNYFNFEKQPYCATHYHEKKGTLCYKCEQPIVGRCVATLGRKYHPEHFNCMFCNKVLQLGAFKEYSKQPYCQPCFIKLYG